MAFKQVPDHPKFMALRQRLGTNKSVTLGYLECVWHFCSRFTPQGNIGKYSDAAIEGWVEWDGEPGRLISSLVEAGWLDAKPPFRLLVHDWSAYADDTVHTTLAKNLQRFADGCAPRAGKLNQPDREKFKNWVSKPFESPIESLESPTDAILSPTKSLESPTSAALSAVPYQTRPNHTRPESPPTPQGAGGPAGAENPTGELAAVAAGFDRHLKHHRDEPRDLVIQHVISLGDKFDQVLFQNRHGPYCDFYDKKGWDFCTLSMLAWIRAGMPPPPKAAVKGRNQNEEVIERLREKFGGESDAR